jgi:hypothetical protein
MNPLHGIEVTGPTIDPLWEQGQNFSFLCFLSHYSKFSSLYGAFLSPTLSLFALSYPSTFFVSKIADLEKRGYVLAHEKGLRYDLEQTKLEIQLNISQSSEFFNNGNSPPRVWSEILRNSSSVYLHTLILREDVDPAIEISSKVINVSDLSLSPLSSLPSYGQSGLGQYGVVQMIKHDIIPKHFKHRYLLSDFGWVPLDPLEGIDRSPSRLSPFSLPQRNESLFHQTQLFPIGSQRSLFVSSLTSQSILLIAVPHLLILSVPPPDRCRQFPTPSTLM